MVQKKSTRGIPNSFKPSPAPKSPQKLPKTYSIETYVEHKGHEVKFLYFFANFNEVIISSSLPTARLILIEKWQLTIEGKPGVDF